MKKLFKVEFEGLYPVGSCLVILADNLREAKKIAKETIVHTDVFEVTQVDTKKSGVVVYLSGDY